MEEIAINDLVRTPDGIGVVDTVGKENVLVKFLPEHGFRPPCEFRIYKLTEIEKEDK